jgi:hypothetical protein
VTPIREKKPLISCWGLLIEKFQGKTRSTPDESKTLGLSIESIIRFAVAGTRIRVAFSTPKEDVFILLVDGEVNFV